MRIISTITLSFISIISVIKYYVIGSIAAISVIRSIVHSLRVTKSLGCYDILICGEQSFNTEWKKNSYTTGNIVISRGSSRRNK